MNEMQFKGNFRKHWATWILWSSPLLVLAPFLPVLAGEFLRWDDDVNFLNNPEFGNLNGHGVRWAWTTNWLGVYQPLAWMFLELQHTIWGLTPGGYHATSLALHSLNTVILYLLLSAILLRVHPSKAGRFHTGSATAAILFAIHPLRVEVVAWISCQPYLPAVLCSMLAVLAYLHAHPEGGQFRPGWLVASLLLSVAAALFKPVAVSLPGLLLILDVYPLRRLGRGSWGGGNRVVARVWLEKLAFAVPAAILMAVALSARSTIGGDDSSPELGGFDRLALACYGIVFYLYKTVWPIGLSAYYPLPTTVDPLQWPFVGAMAAVVGASVIGFWLRHRFPGFLAVWVAYLVILAPNLGFVRVGGFLAADRYTYLASIPWAILVAWGGAQLLSWSRNRRVVRTLAGLAGSFLLIVFGVLSWTYSQTWQTSTSLWTNALAQSQGANTLAIERSLAASLIDAGETEKGIALLRRVLEKEPDAPMVHYNLGVYEVMEGHLSQAEKHFSTAIRTLAPGSPYLADAHFNLGAVHERLGQLDEALVEYKIAARLNPRDPEIQNNLGSVYLQLGRYADAESMFTEALRIRPDYALAQRALEHARRMKDLSSPTAGKENAPGPP